MPRPQIRPNLYRFARNVASHLPGTWTAAPHRRDIIDPDRFNEVWDTQTLAWATAEYRTDKAAVLTRSNDDRLLVMAHPMLDADFIVGALAPPGLGPEPFHDRNAPQAITVPSNPTRAATVITRRFLPRYEEAVTQARLPALTDALECLSQAKAEWDALAGKLCDADGQPLDNDAYEERQRGRNAAAWCHLQTFLFHAPALLADARAAVHEVVAHPTVIRERLSRLDALQAALNGGLLVRAAWEGTYSERSSSARFGIQHGYADAVAQRNREGWYYANEFIAHGPVLLDIARAQVAQQKQGVVPASPVVQAARARSTTVFSLPGSVPPGESPPGQPVPGAPRSPRTR